MRASQPGRLSVADRTQKSWLLLVSTRRDGQVQLGSSRGFMAPPPNITVVGELSLAALEEGAPVRFEGFINDKTGTLAGPISSIAWLDENGFKPGIKTDRKSKDERGHVACQVAGNVESIRGSRLTLQMPRSRYSDDGTFVVTLAPDAKVNVKTRSLSKVREGDRITKAVGVELNTGDLIVQELDILLVDKDATSKPQTRQRKTEAADPGVESKYNELSTEKVAPRMVRSQHYVVHTDISDRDARVLLDTLEQLLSLLASYFGRPQTAPVECYVVSDLAAWPANRFPEPARQKISNGEGLTEALMASNSQGMRNLKATVYSCDKLGVVKHEAVHAYCRVAFGDIGPAWFAEGIAEMGQYWKESPLVVDIDPRVIKYFKRIKPRDPEGSDTSQLQGRDANAGDDSQRRRSVKEIISTDQITGDSWMEYNWRWALCHLLANNPNYQRSFKELGIGYMTQNSGVSFAKSYGHVSKQLIFEFDQFIENIDNGYRADLCAWRWNHRFDAVKPKGHKTVKVLAKAGWQPAVEVEADQEYEYIVEGEWHIDGTGGTTNADGDKEQTGRLVGVLLQDYTLGPTIDLGAKGAFRVPQAGKLYVRCQEAWSRIGDNSGGVAMHIRHAHAN